MNLYLHESFLVPGLKIVLFYFVLFCLVYVLNIFSYFFTFLNIRFTFMLNFKNYFELILV